MKECETMMVMRVKEERTGRQKNLEKEIVREIQTERGTQSYKKK